MIVAGEAAVWCRSATRVVITSRRYATHVPTRVPIIPITSPPPAPKPPSVAAASSSSSSSSKPPSSTSPTPLLKTSTPTHAPSSLPKPRLDYTALLSSPSHTTTNHILRRAPLPLGKDHIAHLERLRTTQVELLRKLDAVRAKQRELSNLVKSSTSAQDRDEHVRQAKKLKPRVGEYENMLSAVESEMLELGLMLPNFTHPDTPIGPEENAVELERFGPRTTEIQEPRRDHLGLASQWDLIDHHATTTATGSSWVYLKSTLALLEMALINYALSIAIRHGYTPVSPPDVIRSDIAWRCGFQPRDLVSSASQNYHIVTEPGAPELQLAGTAEIPLSALFANQILPADSLPRKVVGVGKAFRAEAGARGQDTRGLYRVHEFTKVELFAVSEEQDSETMMEEIREIQKEIAHGLGLSVRVLDMPTEELGASAYRKYDMEAWMPGRGKWGEVSILPFPSHSYNA
ncbi:hypothetical protein BCR39DRAFT_58583 [Naematelia encephala]|uniref:serine--tRNA ligase n=1 Tax=Naematelia encephala TaxID=71784 RepID=A0A1Y2BB81_9TREE|nr:hypothetical protein BCR39DRAFT_58583 [Naematelia encephala]